ncbi:Alpha/Beta hydrolase protein [Xylariaceae sp. FL1651]|nr:Alpha/Beta hydrolase protein [Xylariaceae sp. FL1651]
MAEAEPDELFHLSVNPAAKETIVFLHGLFSSHLEYSRVAPHLPDYHLLLVDLPVHSGSRHIGPFTRENGAARVAALIRAHAHGGRAHVVGLSAGGFVGMQLATQHPRLVASLYVTGATPFRGYQRWLATHPRALYPLLAAMTVWVPLRVYRWATARMGLLPHDDVNAASRANFSAALVREGYADLAAFTLEDSVPALAAGGVRTLVLAGEVVDDVETARLMGRVLRENGSPASEAALVKGAQHPWDLQFPELFAESARAWIEGRELPSGIEKLL